MDPIDSPLGTASKQKMPHSAVKVRCHGEIRRQLLAQPSDFSRKRTSTSLRSCYDRGNLVCGVGDLLHDLTLPPSYGHPAGPEPCRRGRDKCAPHRRSIAWDAPTRAPASVEKQSAYVIALREHSEPTLGRRTWVASRALREQAGGRVRQ